MPEKMKIKLVIIDTCDRENHPQSSPKFMIDTSKVTHIDRWHYSPEGCSKVIETVFNE
jgi:small subunit ribosomal protein S1